MNNPFEVIDARLSNIETLLLDLKHDPKVTDNKSQPTERKTLHSIRELSDFIGCSTVTGQKLKNSGQIPYRQIGRKVMFDSAEVLKAMEQQGKMKGVRK